MSAGRFFVPPAVVAQPELIILPPDIAAQVRSVLRLRPGDVITLLDGTGSAYTVTLTEIGRASVVGQVTAHKQVATEPHTRIILYQGLLKAAKFEWVVQKGTEIGASAFVPVQCARTVAGLEDVSQSKLARWRAIATEAAEQSERGRVPEVHVPQRLADAFALETSGAVRLLAWEAAKTGDGHATTIARALRTADPSASVHLFIGPEGGFTPEEVAIARQHGVQIVTLGPRILRAETAALVALTLTLNALGEMENESQIATPAAL